MAAASSAAAGTHRPSWQAAVLSREAESAHPATAPVAAVAVSAQASETDGVSRLVFDLSARVAVSAFLTDSPNRVVLDLPQVNFQIGAGDPRSVAKGAGLIRSYRFGLLAPGRSRVVIDLAGPAILRRVAVEPIAGGDPSRLVVELSKTDRASFRAAVRLSQAGRANAAIAESPIPPPPAVTVPKPVVVIDPGHGGVDPGASGIGGATEKAIVLDFAASLAAKLRAAGHCTVVMTRSDDSFVSLSDRVRVARDADAALLISVHADSLSDGTVTGATVYTASDRASDAEAARVAETENRADEAAGLAPTPEAPQLSDILFDLTRRETRTYSHVFQHSLVGYWQKIAHLNKNPERSAGFKVLQAPDVPSVLLELGYLSSSQDVGLLGSAAWRDSATERVAAAIEAYLTTRPATDPIAEPGEPPARQTLVSAQTHL